MDQRKNRTTINISSEVRERLRDKRQYKKRNGKHYLETYDDLLIRVLKIKD